jgi:hypothetical protein
MITIAPERINFTLTLRLKDRPEDAHILHTFMQSLEDHKSFWVDEHNGAMVWPDTMVFKTETRFHQFGEDFKNIESTRKAERINSPMNRPAPFCYPPAHERFPIIRQDEKDLVISIPTLMFGYQKRVVAIVGSEAIQVELRNAPTDDHTWAHINERNSQSGIVVPAKIIERWRKEKAFYGPKDLAEEMSLANPPVKFGERQARNYIERAEKQGVIRKVTAHAKLDYNQLQDIMKWIQSGDPRPDRHGKKPGAKNNASV